MRMGLVFAVALLLVTAGCSTLGSDDQSTPTLSPAPVPEEQTETTSLPPGVTATNITDPEALASAHASVLARNSHQFRSVWTVRYPNGSLYGRIDQRVRVTSGRERFRARFEMRGPNAYFLGFGNARVELYSDGSDLYQAVTRDNDTEYSVGALHLGESFHVSVSRPSPRWQLAALVGALDVRLVTSLRGDGSYRLVGSHPSPPEEFTLAVSGSDPRNVSFEAAVTERGLVAEYRLAYTASIDGRDVRVVRTVDYGDVGNTLVDPPGWLDRAARS